MDKESEQLATDDQIATVGDATSSGASLPSEGKITRRINIKPLQLETVKVRVIGETPLLMHAFSDKNKKQMMEKQMKEGKTAKKEARNPKKDYEGSIYRLPDGSPGFPSVGFKCAMISACRYVDGITMTAAKGLFRVTSPIPKTQLAPIFGDHVMDESAVRLSTGVADIRYRARFDEWAAEFLLTINAGVLSAEQCMNLLSVAGYAVGIGDYRPERKGDNGCFVIESAG